MSTDACSSAFPGFRTCCEGAATRRCVTGEAADTEIHRPRGTAPETDPHGHGQGQVGGGQRRLPRVRGGDSSRARPPVCGGWGKCPRYQGYRERRPEKLSGLCPLMAKKRCVGVPAGPLGSGTHTNSPPSVITASCPSGGPPQRDSASCCSRCFSESPAGAPLGAGRSRCGSR